MLCLSQNKSFVSKKKKKFTEKKFRLEGHSHINGDLLCHMIFKNVY